MQSPAAVPLRGLLDELAASARASGAARDVRVDVEPGEEAWVEGDSFLLRRAIANLIDNAIDFSPAGAAVTVALRQSAAALAGLTQARWSRVTCSRNSIPSPRLIVIRPCD